MITMMIYMNFYDKLVDVYCMWIPSIILCDPLLVYYKGMPKIILCNVKN